MNTRALSEEQGRAVIDAVRKLHELEKSKIITTNQEAEKAGLINFIKETAIQHADELFACWSAVRFEYEPFVGVVSLVMDRVSSIRRNRMLAEQIPAQPPENETKPLTPEPDNVVQLPKQ